MSTHGFAFDMMIYLGAAVVCVPMFRWMRLGSVLGYLVAGCAIGPWGLRLVGDTESTMRVSELGVVLMLFVIGLELDPQRLRAMRRGVLRGGSLQVFACAVPLALGGLAIGLPWVGASIVGIALALSSTAIVLHTLTERGLVGTPVGRASFAILLFQDVAALPLLVVVPLLTLGEGVVLGWQGTVRAILAVCAVAVVGRWITPPLGRRVADLRQREVELVERELFEASVAVGRRTLELLGVARHEAYERAAMFRRHNVALLEQLLPHVDDEALSLRVSRSAREDLEAQFERELERLTLHASRGWHHGEEGRR